MHTNKDTHLISHTFTHMLSCTRTACRHHAHVRHVDTHTLPGNSPEKSSRCLWMSICLAAFMSLSDVPDMSKTCTLKAAQGAQRAARTCPQILLCSVAPFVGTMMICDLLERFLAMQILSLCACTVMHTLDTCLSLSLSLTHSIDTSPKNIIKNVLIYDEVMVNPKL